MANNCKYELTVGSKTLKFNSDKELTKYISDNGVTKNGVKFSADINMTERQSQIYNAVISAKNNDANKGKEYTTYQNELKKGGMSAYDFLRFPYKLKNKKESELLSTTFNLENYIKTEADKRISGSDELTNDNLSEVIDEIKIEMEESEVMKQLGKSVHSLAISAVENGIEHTSGAHKTHAKIAKFIEEIAEHHGVEYNEEEIKEYKSNILNQLRDFINYIGKAGTKTAIKPKLSHKESGITDSPDFISVDQYGVPDIIDVTFSKKSYGAWHSAKKIEQAYKLGIYRQLAQNIFPTNDSGLFVAQFTMVDLDLSKFNYAKHINVVNDMKPLTFGTGSFSQNLEELIPSNFTSLHAVSQKSDEQSDKMVSAMFPNYNVASKFKMDDKETLMEKITTAKEKNNQTEYIMYDNLRGGKPIRFSNVEDLEKGVDDYMDRYEKSKHSEVSQLIRAIQDAKKNNQNYISFEKDNAKDVINIMFNKYLRDGWELINNPLFTNQGIIVFRHEHHGLVEAVSVTTNSLEKPYDLGLGSTMVGKFMNNEQSENIPGIELATGKNIEAARMLVVLNSMPELFDNNTISGLKTINYRNKETGYNSLETDIHNFNELYKLISKRDDFDVPNNFINGKIKISNRFDYWYDEIISTLSKLDDNELSGRVGETRPDAVAEKVKWFIDMQKALYKSNTELLGTTRPINDKNDLDYLHILISDALSYYSNNQPTFDYRNPKLGIKGSDILHLPQTILFGKGSEYSKTGEKVVGLFGGTQFTTPDATGNPDFDRSHQAVQIAHDRTRFDFGKMRTRIVSKTNEYYKKAGRSKLEKTLLGNAEPYHEVFFKTDANGTINENLMYKNPYDMTENLKDFERDYLKFMLWEMFKAKSGYKLSKDVLDTNYKNIERLQSWKDYIGSDKYFVAPLAKKTDLSKWSTTDTFRESIGKRLEEWKDDIDPRMITEMQRNEGADQIKGVYEMFNEFNIDSNFREKMIAEYRPEYFEKNMDTMALKLVFSTIRENVMNQVLPFINSSMIQMRYNGYLTGRGDEMEKALEDHYKHLRVAIYGIDPFKKGEVMDGLKVVKQFQKIASTMYITLRPALMAKELIVGTIKNVSFAWSKVYGDDSFTISHLRKAYDKVLFTKKQGFTNFSINENLNMEYGMANMDLNTITKKTKSDRLGVFKFVSDNLYWFNQAPDYVNRMTLLVAKMIKDDVYDAHSFNEATGEFKYDETKDGRFKNYMARRKQHKYKFAENDKDYNDERSLYLTMLDDFNQDNLMLGIKRLNEKDGLPKAYTNKERESIKVFSDTAYGFYDHARAAQWKHTAFGTIFGQFLTYWPAKMKFYFGKRTKSAQGKYQQKFEYDEKTGEKTMLFLKDVTDEKGDVVDTIETTEDTGRKSIHFDGSYVEGLAYSFGLTARDIVTGKSKLTPEDRKRRAKLMLHDMLMGMLLIALVRVFFEDWRNDKGKIEDVHVNQAMEIAEKVFVNALTEMNPLDLFQAFSWKPTIAGMSENLIRDVKSLLNGSGNWETAIRNNLKFTESIPILTEE